MKHPKHSAGFVLYHRPAHEKPRGGRGTFLRAASLFVAAACLTLGSGAPLYYLPILLGASLVTGAVTGLAAACLFRALAHTHIFQ